MNIPASYTETRRYDHTKAPLADVVSKALQSLGWEFEPANLIRSRARYHGAYGHGARTSISG